MTLEDAPKTASMTESQKSRQRTGALQQVSELGGAVRPVCSGQGGGFSSWAGQVILQRAQDQCVQSRNWHFLLVHPAQTCLPEPNRWGWLLRETSSERWDGGVGQSAGLLSILLTLGGEMCGDGVPRAWAQVGDCTQKPQVCPLGGR